ncbi:hypothetical protein C900_01631 [Fulvivirga imtechensis AK7]|uniref:DUF3127 domain-containing protein n=1 Tax=Fulvivirga imtechensis AK7 TaxID=1237149 RepID=L8JXJ7_9BACT|nr:DUF3127 domain-containing protein [Fulvivirga imtechensis]ELR72349.1 hypothetical protein C900_01631 [Fulvivirga imtechensis AK7]
MNVKGKILEISDTQQVSNSFKKREFVLEYAENPQYPEYLKFELIQDKCSVLDSYKANDEVDVYFNLKGRKWTDPKGEVKYFNSLQAWKIEGAGNAQSAPPPSTDNGMDQMEEPGWVSEGDDDLPF